MSQAEIRAYVEEENGLRVGNLVLATSELDGSQRYDISDVHCSDGRSWVGSAGHIDDFREQMGGGGGSNTPAGGLLDPLIGDPWCVQRGKKMATRRAHRRSNV